MITTSSDLKRTSSETHIEADLPTKSRLKRGRIQIKCTGTPQNKTHKEKRGERFGVDKVDIETEEGLKTIVKRVEIEEASIEANKGKLLQAQNTPLRKEPLRTSIGEWMKYSEIASKRDY